MTDLTAERNAGAFAGDEAFLPLPEREKEFNAVLLFLHRRWTRKNHTASLFIYGACGCGKTSTVLRSLRLCSDKPIPGDWANTCTSTVKSTLSIKGEGGSPLLKRFRPEDEDGDDSRSSGRLSSSSSCAASPRSSFGTTAALSSEQEIEFKRSAWTSQYPQLTARKTGKQRIFSHYINCADLTGVQLCDAIISSVKSACPRPDAWSREILDVLQVISLPASKRPLREPLDSNRIKASAPLHVIVIDEVELLRQSGTKAMMELATFAAVNHEVTLIFISNQRHLVHVPQMLREELGFEAYTAPQLKDIARRVTDYGLSEAIPDESVRQTVKVSPGLYEYIARKALLEFSGDARQVAAMCRRVVFASAEEVLKASSAKSSSVTAGGAKRKRLPTFEAARSSQFLKTVIDTYASSEQVASQPSPDDKKSLSSPAMTEKTTPPATTTLSLASSVKLLRSCVVEEEAEQYIMSMTEQMAYVLSCLVVLRLSAGQEEQRRQTSIGGTVASARRSTAVVHGARNSVSLRELNTLYSTLMSRRHFPSMNPSGIVSAVDGLADLSIITRPQRRGNEQLFSFNGTWSLESMEAALKARGEAARAEMESLGLDGTENRFISVFSELKRIVNLI